MALELLVVALYKECIILLRVLVICNRQLRISNVANLAILVDNCEIIK
jgi:hypothetical protein